MVKRSSQKSTAVIRCWPSAGSAASWTRSSSVWRWERFSRKRRSLIMRFSPDQMTNWLIFSGQLIIDDQCSSSIYTHALQIKILDTNKKLKNPLFLGKGWSLSGTDPCLASQFNYYNPRQLHQPTHPLNCLSVQMCNSITGVSVHQWFEQ